jgi:hypothetical protein
MAYKYDFSTLNMFDAILNRNRGTRAPYPLRGAANPPMALEEMADGTTSFLGAAPGQLMYIQVVPQAGDALHARNLSRMLPVARADANSGGWAAVPYSFDPPPVPTPIVIPPAQWAQNLRPMQLIGTHDVAAPGTPYPPMGYPGVFS